MRLFTLIALACLSSVALAQNNLYKGIKQITVYTKSKTDKAPVLDYELHFDKNGNQIKYNSPSLYCTQDWTYNAQNQVTKYEVMCGESMTNGTTTYKYAPKVTVQEEVTGAYTKVTTDTLDAQKNVVSRYVVYNYDVDGEKDHKITRTTFTYNAKNQVVTESIDAGKAGKILKEYTYKGDSLQLVLRTRDGKKDTLLLQDFYRDSKRKASKRYPIIEDDSKKGFYNELYQYDEKGRIITFTKNIKSATDCPNPKIPCAIEMTEYFYKNEQLFQTKQMFYEKGASNGYIITLYDKGIEREKKQYNAQNDFIGHTTYKIQKW